MRTDSITSFCRRIRTVGVGIGAGLFLLTVAAFVRPPLLPAIGRDLGMTAIGLGLLGSVFAAGRLAVLPTDVIDG